MTEPIRVVFGVLGQFGAQHRCRQLGPSPPAFRQHGGDRFEVHSAGTEPQGVNPLTLQVLDEAGSTHHWPARSR